VNNNVHLLNILGLTLFADLGAVRSTYHYVRKEIHPHNFWHSAGATAFQKLGEAWWASRSPSQGSPAPVQTPARLEPSRRQPPNARSARAGAPAMEGAQAQACLPAEDNLFGHYIHSLNPSDPVHGWTQEFLNSNELAGELFELRDFSVSTLTFLDHKLRTAF